jgi:hypothetical protein
MPETFQVPSDIMAKYKNFSPGFYLDLVHQGKMEIVDGVLKEVEAEPWRPKYHHEFTAAEKTVAFNKLHDLAMDHYSKVHDGKRDEDATQFIFEAVMELLGEGVWTEYNRLMEAP